MELLSPRQALAGYGPPRSLTDLQIDDIIKLATINSSDIFYDLGSGHGNVVIKTAITAKPKRAIGMIFG